jgi:hypothetical protein
VGEWRTLRLDPARPAAVACRLCGRPLFGRVWSAELAGGGDFCDPECERLFHEYWLPRYGRDPAAGA